MLSAPLRKLVRDKRSQLRFNPTINLLVDRQAKLRYSPPTIKDLIVGSEGLILGEKEIDYIDGSRAAVDGRAMGEGDGYCRRRG
jgi:hypothetical protein